MGYYIVGIFLVSWIVSMLLFKLRRIDRLDDRLSRVPARFGGPSGE
jgi:hypothetical protein